jgi:glycosyltransferase involved in cell wall biosynthesis
VITLHEYSFNLSWRGRARLWPSIAGAHAVLVSDPAYIRDIRKIFKRKFMDVIPIAPNIPSSTLTAGEREKLRREISPAGSLILGYFGFINANKIVLPVLHAVKMLRDIHGMSVVLMLLGDIFERDPSNPLVRALHNEITALGIEKNIFSTGYVSDVRAADYLSILDYAVLLYRSGISPRNATFLAAAAQNINIISTCNPSYMPSYRKLFLIEPEGDIASGIVDIVLKNGSGARESAIGSALYEQCWKAFVKKHLEVYRRVLMS